MPKQTPELPLPSVQLDVDANLPLHRQLYSQLRNAICTGDLKPGTRLPSTRALALELGVSRTTTIEAYRDLLAEGYVEAKIGAGTVVVHKLPELNYPIRGESKSPTIKSEKDGNKPVATAALRLSQQGLRLAGMVKPSWFFVPNLVRPFRLGVPALDEIPQKAWARAITQAARYPAQGQLDYQSTGYLPLRQEIAAYLALARGVRCTAEQVLITSGVQAGLSLIAAMLLDPGAAIWMEEPGYFLAHTLFQMLGIRMIPVPIDNEGLSVADGLALCPGARLAYVTPSHQFPLGMTMSQARRRELLQWAQQTGSWIVEDDYDSEYRYSGRPIPALQGLDENGRVIYMGTFSKVFFPALRLGYLVVPPSLVSLFTTAQRVTSFHPPTLEQIAMTTFMADGDFTRHIRRMRVLYSERRDCLLHYAAHYLSGTLHFEKTLSGLHLIGWLPENAEEESLARLAQQHGVTVYPLAAFRLSAGDQKKGLVLGFAGFRDAAIKAGVEKLAAAWGK